MAKRSIPAPNNRPLTPEEVESIASDLLAEVRKMAPRGNSLIADEVDADFLKRVTESLKGAKATGPIDVPYIAPKVPEKLADFALDNVSAPLGQDSGLHFRIRLNVVDDYERRSVFPAVTAARACVIDKGIRGASEQAREIDVVMARKDAYALYEDALEQRATRPAGTTKELSWSYKRLMRSIERNADISGWDVWAPAYPVGKRDWKRAGTQVKHLFAQLQIPQGSKTA